MHNSIDCCHTYTHSLTHYFQKTSGIFLFCLFVSDDENSSQLETNVLRSLVNTLEILLVVFVCIVHSLVDKIE